MDMFDAYGTDSDHGSGWDDPSALKDWLGRLRVTQGGHVGESLTILDWEADFLDGAFAPGVQEAALSVARGNGKSTLLGAICAATIDGPLAQPRAQTIIVAASHQQARVTFEHALSFRPDVVNNRTRFAVRNSTMECSVLDRNTGAELRVTASDARRVHGLAPSIAVCDEPAQWAGGNAAMVAALRTALGKIPRSLMVCIGTRPASSLHWFARMLDAEAPGAYRQCHMADDIEAFADERQWRLANPMYDFSPDLAATIAREAKAAESDDAAKASFVALRLNAGTPETAETRRLIEPEEWRSCLESEPRSGEHVHVNPVWGVDLGGSAAMSAVCAAWPNGEIATVAMFGCEPSLEKRDKRDGAGGAYAAALAAGELVVSKLRVPPVAELLEEGERRFGEPSAIVCDRWRIGELYDALDQVGWRCEVIPRAQGFRDGSEDVRGWRKAVESQTLHPRKPAILLTLALSEAVLVSDSNANWKLAKGSQGGRRQAVRDDVAAAAILGVAHRDLRLHTPRRALLGVA